ncbi:hypothetical protein AY607_01065 [Acinetobacter sp. SFA]|nr:hypothetical protein AY607_01065 [Acinetobacter sp. SFA]OAL85008.1 hypothetical protein AY605_05060 [Acinetobacter sp. SFD]
MRRYHHTKKILICIMNNNTPQRYHHSSNTRSKPGNFLQIDLEKNKHEQKFFLKRLSSIFIYQSQILQCLKNVPKSAFFKDIHGLNATMFSTFQLIFLTHTFYKLAKYSSDILL